MKTDKEYPATHSMSTAWYCVDEDGNVGIFDIDDNGPVPVGGYEQNTVDEVFWNDFSFDIGAYNILNLKPEQILPLLETDNDRSQWEKDEYGWTNYKWMGAIINIDMSKLDIFKKAVSLDTDRFQRPICISRDMGLFYVNFFRNMEGIELLENNGVILEKYKAPRYLNPDMVDNQERVIKENNKFPFFIYHQCYNPNYEPAIKLTNPTNPMKFEQLPEKIKAKVTHLPIKFKDAEKIQLAEMLPVDIDITIEYVYDGQIWCELATSDDSLMYYNKKTKAILNKENMDKLIAEGKAEEYDWDKHRDLKK